MSKINYFKNYPDLFKSFENVIEKNGEGLIVKKQDGFYQPNLRSENWIKMKGDYLKNYLTNLDLCVIGGYFGSNSWLNQGVQNDYSKITDFLLGLVETSASTTKIIPLCKVSQGFTKTMLLDLQPFLKSNYIFQKEMSDQQVR